MAEKYNAIQKQFDPFFECVDEGGQGLEFSLGSWKLHKFTKPLLDAGFNSNNIHTISKQQRNNIIAIVGADAKLNKKFKAFITKCSIDGRKC